jgi:hypothetical protein
MRLIDADALMADIERTIENSGCVNHEGEIMDCVRYASEVDAVPVVRGEWVKSDDYKGWLVCSACRDCYVDNAWVNGKKWRYCPNCGALMEDKP